MFIFVKNYLFEEKTTDNS